MGYLIVGVGKEGQSFFHEMQSEPSKSGLGWTVRTRLIETAVRLDTNRMPGHAEAWLSASQSRKVSGSMNPAKLQCLMCCLYEIAEAHPFGFAALRMQD